jgi:hypothetical protein
MNFRKKKIFQVFVKFLTKNVFINYIRYPINSKPVKLTKNEKKEQIVSIWLAVERKNVS